MKQRYPLIGLLVLMCACLGAQDEAIFNHYVQTPVILNPAAAGFTDHYTLQLNARASWAGYSGSPKTGALRLSGPVGDSFGASVAVFSESAAQQDRLKGQLDLGFRFRFGREVRGEPTFQAAIGFYTQIERISLDGSVITGSQYMPGDEEIMAYLDGDNNFDAGIGVYGTYLKNTFGGVTVNNLVRNRLENISGTLSEPDGFNYTFLLGHHLELDGAGVSLIPSIMLRNIQGAPFMMDINLQASFLEDQFLAGLSYRQLGAVGMLLGTRLNGFQLYYSYDLSFGGFQEYHNGSHELTVAYSINRQDILVRRRQKALESNRRKR